MGEAERRLVLDLIDRLDARPLEGVVDLSPGYASILVRFDPLRLDHAAVGRHVLACFDEERAPRAATPRLVTIPVVYGGAEGPDLEEVARRAGLSAGAAAALHASTTYVVHFLGFTPGFAYLGTVPDPLACPRLDQPRTSVPAGSVGIAGAQTGVYPASTPGGWRIVGRTTLRLFDPRRSPAATLAMGDRVRFVPIERPGPDGPRA